MKALMMALVLMQTSGPTPEVELAQLNTSLWVSLSNAPQQKPDIAQLQRLFAAADFTGVNSVQWALTDAGWKIVSLYYQVPKNDAPLELMEYTSGKCLNDYS